MGVSYKKDGNRVDMGIKIGTVLSSEVWNIQVKSIKKGFVASNNSLYVYI